MPLICSSDGIWSSLPYDQIAKERHYAVCSLYKKKRMQYARKKNTSAQCNFQVLTVLNANWNQRKVLYVSIRLHYCEQRRERAIRHGWNTKLCNVKVFQCLRVKLSLLFFPKEEKCFLVGKKLRGGEQIAWVVALFSLSFGPGNKEKIKVLLLHFYD